MAFYQIPVTVLTTGDELLYMQSIYVTDDVIDGSQFKSGYKLQDCALTGSALFYASNLTVAVHPTFPIFGISNTNPAPNVLKSAGFKHIFTITPGSYHWVINGQKFFATVIEIRPNETVPVAYPQVILRYMSGSYADKHPNYVGQQMEVFNTLYSNQLRTFFTPTDSVLSIFYPSTPAVTPEYVTSAFAIPKYYSWMYRKGTGEYTEKIFREIIYNIPTTQNEDTPEKDKVHIGDTYPEYDPTASGPTSNPQNPEDNPDIGDFDTESDPIPPPDIDELNKHSAVNTGLISIYNPTIGGVAQLANFLWSDLFSLDTFKKMFGSPMEAILSLHLIPVQPTTGAEQNVIIGNVNTEISMKPVTQQFVSFHCGAVKIQSFFGSALDFSPFTKMSIFLPYIGVRELDIDEIMYKSVGVQYLFDVLTGACTALITVDGDVMYQFSGSASLQMPINATNWTNVINNIMSLATATIATVASSGAAAGQLLTSSANAVTSSKMGIERSGAVTGAAGFLAVQTPYLIRTIPRQSLAKNYQHYSGYPSNITAQLGSLSGYTEVEQVFLDGVTATEAEKTEILSLLKGGVII